jgi:hypothetical protein
LKPSLFLLLSTAIALGCAQNPPAHADHHANYAPATELNAQLEAVRNATVRYRDFENARRDGYKRFGKEGPLMGEHWYHPDIVKQPLDLQRPSTLQYAIIDGRRVLVGVAYTVYNRPGDPLPEGFAGDDDHWHVHDVNKIARAITEERPLLRWLVDRRIAKGKTGAGNGRTHLTMLHAWVWSENPAGVFALEHKALPYLRTGIPLHYAQHADEFAPYGVTLLDARGCNWELGKIKLLARPSKEQNRDLTRACAAAAEHVRKSDVAQLNDVASRAWREYLSVRDSVLTAEQKQRLMVGIEHTAQQPHHHN